MRAYYQHARNIYHITELLSERLSLAIPSPPGKKKHKTYPGGHSLLGWYDDMVKDTHDWFDEQFGPVNPVERK